MVYSYGVSDTSNEITRIHITIHNATVDPNDGFIVALGEFINHQPWMPPDARLELCLEPPNPRR
jgi:hypothetical protein